MVPRHGRQQLTHHLQPISTTPTVSKLLSGILRDRCMVEVHAAIADWFNSSHRVINEYCPHINAVVIVCTYVYICVRMHGWLNNTSSSSF